MLLTLLLLVGWGLDLAKTSLNSSFSNRKLKVLKPDFLIYEGLFKLFLLYIMPQKPCFKLDPCLQHASEQQASGRALKIKFAPNLMPAHCHPLLELFKAWKKWLWNVKFCKCTFDFVRFDVKIKDHLWSKCFFLPKNLYLGHC